MGPGDHTTKAILETPIDSRNLNTPEHPDTQHPLCNSNANRLRRNKYTLHVIYIYITLVCLCVFSLIACSLGNIHLGVGCGAWTPKNRKVWAKWRRGPRPLVPHNMLLPGLPLNAARVFKSTCSCLVVCSVLVSECVLVACSGLDVFGVLGLGCCVRFLNACVVFHSVFICLVS
jgi:hypothetical protein